MYDSVCGISVDRHTYAAPARPRKEMPIAVRNIIDTHGGARKRLGWRVIRTVNEPGFTNQIGARHKSPIPAIERGVPVIPDRKIAARRHHHFTVHDMMIEHVIPRSGKMHVGLAWEIVAVSVDI